MNSARLFSPVSIFICGRSFQVGLVVALAWLVCPLMVVGAENFGINPRVMSAGGGLSRSATFTVAGTIGEPWAGPIMNGPKTYSVVSGFWSVLGAQQRMALSS